MWLHSCLAIQSILSAPCSVFMSYSFSFRKYTDCGWMAGVKFKIGYHIQDPTYPNSTRHWSSFLESNVVGRWIISIYFPDLSVPPLCRYSLHGDQSHGENICSFCTKRTKWIAVQSYPIVLKTFFDGMWFVSLFQSKSITLSSNRTLSVFTKTAHCSKRAISTGSIIRDVWDCVGTVQFPKHSSHEAN